MEDWAAMLVIGVFTVFGGFCSIIAGNYVIRWRQSQLNSMEDVWALAGFIVAALTSFCLAGVVAYTHF